MDNIVTIKIEKETADYLEDMLGRVGIDFHKEKIAEDSTIERFTAYFPNGYFADIGVCSGTDNCFVNPVIFNEAGCEMNFLEADDELFGEYVFGVNDVDYTVIVERA